MINMRGTRQQIIESWKSAYDNSYPDESIDKQIFENLFDTLLAYSKDFSEDELFVVLNARFNDGDDRLLTPDTEYFIGVASSTWTACALIAAVMTNPVAGMVMTLVERLHQFPYIDIKPFVHLNNQKGEGCIMLEAFEKRRDGIDENVLEKYKGECVHANLGCCYMIKETGRCKCNSDCVKNIIEDLEQLGLLKRKRRKYFYNDIL